MTEHDPKRLLDGGADPGALRSLLEAGRSEMPNDRQMMMLAAKVGALGGLGGAGAAGLGGAGGAGGVGAAGAGGASAKAAVGAATATAAKTGLAIKVAAVAVAAAAAGTSAVVVANRTAESVAAPVGIVATSAPTGMGTSTSESTPTSTSESATPARSVATRAPNVASAVAKDEGPEAEVKLLERAQDALRSRPTEALALCNDHAKRFPSGMLVQEREVIAMEALLKTGRKDEARARADKFKARFPGSSHTRRLETLLAN